MSVKISRYIFRRINGRIIPIRKGIEQASKQVNKLAKEALLTPTSIKTGEPAKKYLVGRGVDFNVFGKKSSIVLKIPRLKKGTANKSFIRRYPETADKVALSKAVSENLPNYGIATLHQEPVRLHGKLKGIIQEKARIPDHGTERVLWHKAFRNRRHYQDTAEKIRKETGLHLDTHGGNFDFHGNLIDTGVNLKTSSITKFKHSDMGKEILGVSDGFGSKIKDHVNPKVLTDDALSYGVSRKALKKINELRKKGYKFKQTGKNEYKLVFHKLRNKK